MFKLGRFVIEEPVVLAPMAGYTSFAYRNFMAKFGVKLVYTEMVSDMGLIYGNKETFSYIDFPKTEQIVGVQLFGVSEENLVKALKICEEYNPNIDFYDINMGCPVPKVTKTGAGSSLLKDPKKCGNIIRELKKVTDKPVTAKIRLGFDSKSINYLEVIKELEDAGVDLIALHARTTKDLYGGEPRFEMIKDLGDKTRVPLIISGNVFTAESALNAMKITKAKAVMVARGGIGNPLLITNINNRFNDKEEVETNLDKQIGYCLELAKAFIEEKGEVIGMRVYRSISPRFFASFPNSKQLRGKLASEVSTYQDLEKILMEYQENVKKFGFN